MQFWINLFHFNYLKIVALADCSKFLLSALFRHCNIVFFFNLPLEINVISNLFLCLVSSKIFVILSYFTLFFSFLKVICVKTKMRLRAIGRLKKLLITTYQEVNDLFRSKSMLRWRNRANSGVICHLPEQHSLSKKVINESLTYL